ncbi:hypothetical protein O181_052645 [Austropuccinia psidii MF-1]|uniref:Phosphatidylinositol-specific phospholipase C X domain-containing protein n=1 Tax=Austropuccinia psidii MF-1 TaxID=1389203 RepID=A0A9Q3E5C0_9BASI|nr:hypothetical protein [Austropuccinia psidii MF-1]
MVYHLPLSISNRTSSLIRVSHLSFNDLVPPRQTTPTKAIPSEIKIKHLKISVSVELSRPNEILVQFVKQKRFSSRKRFWRLDVTYDQQNINQINRMHQKGKRPTYEIFQSISDDGSIALMALESRDFSNWMSSLPDQVALTSLTIPGSHQSCALYGWPIATCHTRPLSRQLEDGIRFVDIGLALPHGLQGQLIAYNGFQSQLVSFHDILRALITFLDKNPTEVIIINIKQEDRTNGFNEALKREILAIEGEEAFQNRWWLDSALPPSLGQARGKLILLSRGKDTPVMSKGIQFPNWPINSNCIWETQISTTNVAVQDWSNIGSFLSLPKKSSLACVSLCRALHEPLANPPALQENPQTEPSAKTNTQNIEINPAPKPDLKSNNQPETWVINFLSASALALAFPVICAKGFGWSKNGLGLEGVNSVIARWLVSRRESEGGATVSGVVCVMDYYQSPKEALVSLLVDCNFR